jgi:hypothetical protein
MQYRYLFLCFFFTGFLAQAQKTSKDFRSKKIIVKKDSIRLDSVAINPQLFKILDARNKLISSENYTVFFSEALLIINSKKYSDITVKYYRFPNFITRVYTPFNEELIVENTKSTEKLYSLTTNKKPSEIKLFDGLKTKGFISRGLTSGNNQNAVTNAALDLEISGKLSKNVSLRANIFDTNVPLQQNGYSQNITDFDRIFIEMYSNNWRVKAGDISLQNKESFFIPFNKQVAGLEVEANINEQTKVSASGAIVRGKFSTFYTTAIEGNQGPYKILGPNNEPAIIIIEGSETVYINGTPIQNGENKDYIIDYNLAEIKFNTTFPITNDMRIAVDFQFSDRNYTRFVTYETAKYKSEKFTLEGYFYNENDAKNQPLQQSLTDSQKQILANAGNEISQMVSESAFIDTFSENKILYEKVLNGIQEVFEYSTNENAELYSVTFTNVGSNNGSYSFNRSVAIGNIFEFVGDNLGDYNPIVQLIAPTKFQVAALKSSYQPNNKTNLNLEIAISNNDQNLFSSINDDSNSGIATLIGWQQTLIDKRWQLKSDVNFEFKHQNFFSEQGFESIEFNRDWNLISTLGNKSLLQTKFSLSNKQNNSISYSFNQLNYSENFHGSKHVLSSKIQISETFFSVNGSFLNNTSTIEKNSFLRAKAKIEKSFSKSWLGAFVNVETNDRKNKITQDFINTSHRFKEYEAYFGLGDSTKTYTKIGFNYRNNDSIKSNQFTEINNRKTWYLNSKLIQNKKTNLAVFANYRITENAFQSNEKSLNSKIVYNQRLLKDFITFGTIYETSSGNIAQQDYVYVKTEPGFGFYTWIDYNDNGIQEFNEFEIAQFQDQATYLRVPLPNLRYLPTQEAKFSQSLTLNPNQWKQKGGVKKVISHFYNQSFLSITNEQERIGNSFNFNPFDFNETKLIGLNSSFRNSFYFNRNLQKHSIIYTFGASRNRQQYLIGSQENKISQHQLEYKHKFASFWVFDVLGKLSENNLETENFSDRNYNVLNKEILPKISFTYHKNHRLSAYYNYKNKKNELRDFEQLKQQQFGLEYFQITKNQQQISLNLTAFLNDFTGNENTPVGYQMLEGLQNGRNYTWSFLFNKKLNSVLNLNINYLGRKSENSKTIHTGSIQLKALF